jgi:hypothetical protein
LLKIGYDLGIIPKVEYGVHSQGERVPFSDAADLFLKLDPFGVDLQVISALVMLMVV